MKRFDFWLHAYPYIIAAVFICGLVWSIVKVQS